METIYKKLNWDSSFFNFNVGQILTSLDESSQDNIFQKMYDNDIKLAYYSSLNPLKLPEHLLYSLALVDIKVAYRKQLQRIESTDVKIKPFTESDLTNSLVQLAIASGTYSRFKIDEKITKRKFEDLYKQWIINSISKQIADEVLIYKENEIICGFITIGTKQNMGDIGLIAVREDYRGRGIGKKLIISAENFALNKFKMIQVVTQMDNLPACKLYISCGYEQVTKEYIYHLWKR